MSQGLTRTVPRLPLRVKNVYGPEGGIAPGADTGSTPAKQAQDVMGTPPRKRAVPLDGVHVRNVPDSVPGKRARLYQRSGLDPSGRRATAEGTGSRVGAATPPMTRSTTRIDKSTRVSQEERYQREQQKAQSQRQWKVAFGRAFPKFVFYLDEMDEAQKRTFSAQIHQLGACVEEFFSRNVTHVVTTRPVPSVREEDTKKTGPAANPGHTPPKPPAPSSIASPRIVMPVASAHLPLHSERNPMDEWTQPLPANDLLSKAQHFGMKIWRMEKLQNILSLLLADDAPAETNTGRQALSEMLLQEKLHGTTERDPLAMRSDVHYFGKQSYHVLVTDATGEHRPILIAEYDRSAQDVPGKPTPWPVLHGEMEGRGLFSYMDSKERRRLARQPLAPPSHQSLRRTASLNLLQACPSPRMPGTPNLMASDNSIALASTVASTTSTNITSQHTASIPMHPDRRLMDLHRRLHTPIELPVSEQRPAADGRGAVVQRMLGMLDGPRGSQLRRSQSTDSVARTGTGPKRPREKKPGHCENCRCRYDDFEEHTKSRRHRKFALDESNFVNIDELLQRVQREPLPPSTAWSDYALPYETSPGHTSPLSTGESVSVSGSTWDGTV